MALPEGAPPPPGSRENLATLLQQGRFAEASPRLRELVQADPGDAQSWLQLGHVARALGDAPLAREAFERAARLRPADPMLQFNLGVVLGDAGDWVGALGRFEQAIALHPGYVKAIGNRATALARLGRLEESIPAFLEALALDPSHHDARYNLALAQLTLGDFEQGLRNYEARWTWSRAHARRHGSISPWTGNPVPEGTTILLWAEQGLGDTVQFSRYAPMVAAQGARVVMEVQPPLVRLLGANFPAAQVIALGETPPACQWQAPLPGLPRLLGTRIETIPGGAPYLRADPQRAARMRARLGEPGDRPLVGVCVSGSATHANDARRSMPLAALAPLARIARLVLVQQELRASDEEALRALSILDLRAELREFADTAALLESLDAVASVDTSVAHVAGALGRPLWLMLAHESDWRWLRGRVDSPWYPAARLVRQSEPGNWEPVATAVTQDIAVRFRAFPR